ncbi:hypothetical protein [Propionivibrio dicarboxylicus]|uniref:hypothetical protein n=1 Tax=Propionivibrio dicarboxylicus TaxID=83767 RepID=UPI000B8427D3|nr:hypothetical protein [Propionivibrio dicarboxylicus]
MPIRLAQSVLLATLVMLGACGTRGPVTLTPAQMAEQQAWLKARQQALQQQAKQAQDSPTQRQDATTAVDTTTTKEASR